MPEATSCVVIGWLHGESDRHELSERLILPLAASVDLRRNHHHHLTLFGSRAELAAHHVPVTVGQNLDRGLIDPLEVMNAGNGLSLADECIQSGPVAR